MAFMKNFMLLTIVATLFIFVAVEGRYRRSLSDSTHYFGIYGKWYIIAGMNPYYNRSRLTCMQRTISKSVDDQFLIVRDTYKADDEIQENIFHITESSRMSGQPAIDVTRFNDGKEIIFHETAIENLYVLLSRNRVVSEKTYEEFVKIAESLKLKIVNLSHEKCRT